MPTRPESLLAACLIGAACLVAAVPAAAQGKARIARIGVLWQTAPPPPVHPHLPLMLRALKELGWEEGRNLAIEHRHGGSDAARLAVLAADLVGAKVDVIATAGDLSTRAAQQATPTIPIVALVGFPVESGFAKSLSRPGGNITGFAVIADELGAKRLELLKDLLPRLRRVAVLWDPVTHERQPKAVESAAASLGLNAQVIPAKSAAEFEAAFDAAIAARAEAMLVLISPMFLGNRDALVRLASRHRMPAVYHHPTFTDAGGLIAYGPSVDEQWQQIAGAIDKILKGSHPAELPFQQPSRFELEVNLKAAREIGLEVPQSILLRANRLIE